MFIVRVLQTVVEGHMNKGLTMAVDLSCRWDESLNFFRFGAVVGSEHVERSPSTPESRRFLGV